MAASPLPIPFASRRTRYATALSASIAALLLLVMADLVLGPVPIRLVEVGRVVLHHMPLLRALPHLPPSEEADTIIWALRLPRALTAALVGTLLGYAGVALQGLLMNPLADPYTIGVSSGAAVGAALAEVLGLSTLWYGFGGTVCAFICALAAITFVYALARVGGRVSAQTFLLAGVVVGTLLWSLIPLLFALARRADLLSRVINFLIGSVSSADWTRVGLLTPFALATAVCLRLWSRDLNLMTFGEESAAHLGVEIEAFKRRVLLIGSVATAAAVSVAGIIGFVGLVVPHVARRIVGPDHRAVLPLSALFGALLLLASDLLVRVYLDEIPVGVITSLVGAPVFCYLLRRRRAAAW